MQDSKQATFTLLTQMLKMKAPIKDIHRALPVITEENIEEAQAFFKAVKSDSKNLEKLTYKQTLVIYEEVSVGGWNGYDELSPLAHTEVRINPIFLYASKEQTPDRFIQFLITLFPADTVKLLENLRKIPDLQDKCPRRWHKLEENSEALDPSWNVSRHRIINNTRTPGVASSMTAADREVLVKHFEKAINKAIDSAQLDALEREIGIHPVINEKTTWEKWISKKETTSYYDKLMLAILSKRVILPVPRNELSTLPLPSAPPFSLQPREGEPELSTEEEIFEPGAPSPGISSATLLNKLGRRGSIEQELTPGENPEPMKQQYKNIGGPLHSLVLKPKETEQETQMETCELAGSLVGSSKFQIA